MLTLSILRCPDAVPPQTKQVSGGEFRIGRGPDNDWVMPDPERLLSKKHCIIAYRNGGWAIADTSTNGTYLNRDGDPIGAGQVRALADGDRIRMGAYEIEVRIAEEPSWQSAAPAAGRAMSSFDDPFGDDPLAAPKPVEPDRFSEHAFGGSDPLFGGPAGAPPSITLPDDFDLLGPAPQQDFRAAPATQADHTPAYSDAFTAPRAIPQLPAEDDDWDLGFGPAKPAAPQPFAAPPPPPPPLPPAPVAPAEPADPFGEEPFAAPPRPAPSANPFAEEAPPPPLPPLPPVAAPIAPPAPVAYAPAPVAYAPAPAPVAAPSAAPAPGGDALLAAFLEGAGMAGAHPADPAALMRTLGAAFRATVSGIRQALIARATIKGEFRIEQTMIRSRGNNPLKFSADDDDALSALLGVGRRVDMKPDAAVADALRDMRLHELATMAAMQDAVRALLVQLDPARLRAEAEQGGGLIAAQKKARAFEAFEKLHDTITRALADDFDSVFGKSFARAYEIALRDISAKDV
jgi:type VI secretion system protein ImpI/type VI secretion system protein